MSEQQGGGEQAAFAAGVATATAQQASEESAEASAGAEAAQETASVAVQEAVSASETAWAARSDVDGLADRLGALEAKLTAPEQEPEDRAPKAVEPKTPAAPVPAPEDGGGGGGGGGKAPKKKKKKWFDAE